jgi:hypothetical protein
MPTSEPEFTMDAPAFYNRGSNYAFWMTTSDRKLLAAVRSMNCVSGMKRSRTTGRILVELSDDHDPDEAWHWIRKEIEDTINDVELDDIWIEAMKWIL